MRSQHAAASDVSSPPPLTASDLREKFASFGEILDVDVRKNGAYATVEFADVAAVAQAIVSHGGKMRLAFGRSPPNKCVWCSGLPEGVNERLLQAEFKKFGKIQDILLDRGKGTALVYFDQVRFGSC